MQYKYVYGENNTELHLMLDTLSNIHILHHSMLFFFPHILEITPYYSKWRQHVCKSWSGGNPVRLPSPLGGTGDISLPAHSQTTKVKESQPQRAA